MNYVNPVFRRKTVVNIFVALAVLILFFMPWVSGVSGYDIWNNTQSGILLFGCLIAPIASIILTLRGNDGFITSVVLPFTSLVMVFTFFDEHNGFPIFSADWGLYAYVCAALVPFFKDYFKEYSEESKKT